MVRHCLRSLAALSVLLSVIAHAQAPAPKAQPNCEEAVRRQFDFWVGDWAVTVQGKPAGENRIEKILNGCALLENWTGAGGMSGKSLNYYDPRRGQWHQTWVDDRGGSLNLDGVFGNGSMVLSGEQSNTATKTVTMNRITWTPLPSGQVRQLWETSTDGKSWSVAFDGLYTRKQ
jgi:hypothetical protein